MKCDLPREDLVAFFYGETADRDRIEQHVGACAACRRELAALQSTSALLKAWPDENPRLDLRFAAARAPRRWRLPAWGRLAAGLAAACAAVALFLAAAEFEIRYRAGQLDLKWGRALAADQPGPLTRAEMLAVQEHTLELVDELLRASETRQQQTLGQALTAIARDLEARRYQDLQLVGRRFDQFDRAAQTRFRRNESALLELLPARHLNDR